MGDLPISLRFLLPSVVLLILVMAATVNMVGHQISSVLTQKAEVELVQNVHLVRAMMESTLDAVEREATRLLDIYAARYPGTFTVETGEGAVPLLKHNRVLVNGLHDEEDAFAKVTRGPTATVLVRRGEEFVRIATSQKNDKGERVINTVLDKESPVTTKLLAGEAYVGRTTSQGKDRISALKPIKDESGRVIGAFGIGYFITQEMNTLRERVKSVKVGESGYMYVLDAQAGKKRGDVFIHPAKEGSNILAAKDASGREFIREMLDRKDGVIIYPWLNAELGETHERDKVVAFETIPKWGLLLGGGTYREEFDSVSQRLYVALSTACLLVVIILAFVMVWISRRVLSARLNGVLSALRALSTGNYQNRINVASNDELGQVLQGLESMQTRLGFEVSESKRQADEMTRIKIGLDNVSTNVRIADPEGQILYINHALRNTFARDAAAFRARDPAFDEHDIVGTSIGRLYDDPEAAINRLRNLSATTQTQMVLGGRNYKVVTTPVLNERGERLGSVGEWQDVTDQLRAQQKLTEVIRQAVDGDFSVRLSLDSRDEFFDQIETLINQLLSNGEAALGELSEVLSSIAEGDLTARIASDYQGVFGQLKNNTNSTADRLQAVIGEIKAAAESINTAAQEIASGNQDLSSRTEEQASSLEETSSSMEELNATVRQNSENALLANQVASASNEVASRGGDMVKRVVETMTQIQGSSHKIADIIAVIDGIAFQTNILALNAAVEAARAGDQGRGFAVVATEVRNLAKRSSTAAREIRGLISDSVAMVDSGVVQVEEAGHTMDEVVSSFDRLAALVTDIANASREQTAGIDQVTHAVAQMDEVTQQNAALVEQAAAAAESLEEQAGFLAETVSKFHLGEASGRSMARLAAPPQLPAPALSAEPVHKPAAVGLRTAEVPRLSSVVDDEWAEF
jgi:methyl-accepting chemotaxis protein